MDAIRKTTIAFLRRPPVLVLSALLATHAAAFYALPQPDDAPPVTAFSHFPRVLQEWRTIQDAELEPGAIQVVQPDDYLFRVVERAGGSPLSVLIGYFRTQRNGHMPHSPRNCLPAHGWSPLTRGFASVTPLGLSRAEEVNVFELQRQDQRQVVFYWYQTPARVIAREWMARVYLFGDALHAGRTDTTLVRITAPVVNGDTKAAVRQATDFSASLMPALQLHLRGESH